MKFEAYKDIESILNQRHIKHLELHSDVQQFYVQNRSKDPGEKIINLKDFHWKVMEIYKEFRIYFRDLKAYELQSAVYNYYYEYVKDELCKEDFNDYYFMDYQAIKDAYGLMISEIKIGLVNVNFIKKADKKLEKNKLEEYEKYSKRLQKIIDKHLQKTLDKVDDSNAKSLVDQATKIVKERLISFKDEYNNKIDV